MRIFKHSKILRFTSNMPHSIRELIPYTSPIHDATREASPEYGSMALQKYRNLVFCKAHYYIITSAE